MRGREFLMKDMYSFDVNIESAKNTYEEVCYSYDQVFQKIGVPFAKSKHYLIYIDIYYKK